MFLDFLKPLLVEVDCTNIATLDLISSLSKHGGVLQPNGLVDVGAVKAQVARATARFISGLNTYAINTGKHHPSDLTGSISEKRQVSSGTIIDVNGDGLWSGSVTIGSQRFVLQIDTGSASLFVPSSTCGSTCNGHTKYNPTSSSTSVSLGTNFTINYLDGSNVSGTLFNDTVTISGLSATSQTFGAASQYSTSLQAAKFPVDGILGLAFQSISALKARPFFQTLMSQGKVSSGVFAIKLASSGGSLTLGGINSAAYTGDIVYTLVTTAAYWQVKFDSLVVAGTTVAGSTPAVLDTGTNCIIGADSPVRAFWAKIPEATEATDLVGSGYWTFPCTTTLPTVTLAIAGKAFTISPDTLNYGPVGNDGRCLGTLVTDLALGSKLDFWILGEPFLRNTYTIFDVTNLRVGFAKLRRDKFNSCIYVVICQP
ncbi:hypothetical protein M408DRAFT_29085 [Serendipita vermifera MAFF 305830]|uniref:Peptidase A1 domain-containing protein n=1 Tax=Serendipita vermifera MAFF 305830 TaxID=933852 RepID=A0A0C2W6D3_SERVB|nr:hypothetical protein M408DRAFT_29085 [Serendipita vermifera MAFF 305830]